MRESLRKIPEKELPGNVIFLGKEPDVVRGCGDTLEDSRGVVFALLQDQISASQNEQGKKAPSAPPTPSCSRRAS